MLPSQKVNLIHFFLFALGISGEIACVILGVRGEIGSFFYIALASVMASIFFLVRTDLWIGRFYK